MSEHRQQESNIVSQLDTNESQCNQASSLNQTYNKRPRTSSPNYGTTNRGMIALIVYLALLLDNVLLTVIGKSILKFMYFLVSHIDLDSTLTAFF